MGSRRLVGWCAAGAVLMMLVAVAPAVGDVVKLKDGRVLEGTVVEEQPDAIQFRIATPNIKVTLSFNRADIESLEKKPPSEPVAEDAELLEPEQQAASGLYIEVPIVGRFKEQVFASAVRSSLARAKQQSVRHIVFTVDSDGGAIDEAGTIFRILQSFANDFEYHSIVRKCHDGALIVPFLSKTIHVIPGASVGGTGSPLEHRPARYAAKEEPIYRAYVADQLRDHARRMGRTGDLIHAMIDPDDALVAWVNAEGKVEVAPALPAGVAEDRVIFRDDAGSLLMLSFEQVRKLGLPVIEGGVAALGEALGIQDWREESAYGREMMNKAVARDHSRKDSAQAKAEDAIARNIRMREETKQAIDYSLKQAAKWNPTEASYQTLGKLFYWEAGFDMDWDVSLWTPASRAKWQSRTEACDHYLSRAETGARTLIRLEKEAAGMGLPPLCKTGDLEFTLDDIATKREMLRRGKNRIGE